MMSLAFKSKLNLTLPYSSRLFGASNLNPLKFTDLKIELSKRRPKLPQDHQYIFGKILTDHMLQVDWSSQAGWGAPKIHAVHDFQMNPACQTLHYALQCFQGLKAYPTFNSDKKVVNLFRPELNMARFNKSSKRLGLPTFDQSELLKCLKKLVQIEKEWMPFKLDHSLYIRPTHIATQNILVGPYYSKGVKPVSLLALSEHVRAWPGGAGEFKLGSNYAPTIGIQKLVQDKGYDQILWLTNGYIGEVGTSNVFFLWKRKSDGKVQLVTPQLDGTILPGITRRSVLEYTRKKGDVQVCEKRIKVSQVVQALQQKRLLQCFGAGTAAVVSPVSSLCFDDTVYNLQIRKDLNSGEFTSKLRHDMNKLYSGQIESEWITPIQ